MSIIRSGFVTSVVASSVPCTINEGKLLLIPEI